MSSTSSTRSDLRANGSLRFDNSSGNLADLYGWEVPRPGTSIGTSIGTSSGSSTRSFPLESKGGASAAPTLQRERTSFFPQSPSVLATAYESPAQTPPPLDPPSNRPSPLILPSLPTPPTPNDSAPSFPWSSANSKSDHSLPTKQPSQVGNAAVILNSSGSNVLSPPVSATPRPGSAPFAAGEASEFVRPSTSHGRPLPGQPNPILKIPNDFSIEPSPKTAAVTKSRRMQMKSLFSKDT
ncbi:MAG: hypothetical protein Q9192_006216 [Flavoplaca navasiana]